MELYIDASALIALGHEPDRHHKVALAHSADIPADVVRVASDYIFGETVTVLQKLSGHRVAVRAGQAMLASSNWRWVKVSDADFEEAWSIFERSKEELSFNDCTILAQMRRLGIETLFTFDQAFRKAGVKVVPTR